MNPVSDRAWPPLPVLADMDREAYRRPRLVKNCPGGERRHQHDVDARFIWQPTAHDDGLHREVNRSRFQSLQMRFTDFTQPLDEFGSQRCRVGVAAHDQDGRLAQGRTGATRPEQAS